MKERLSIGVIGCGHWGPNHIRNFSAPGASTVSWAADTSEQRLKHMGALYPQVRMTRQLSDVLADAEVDAVVVATPTGTHYDVALAAIRAGKHVLCEKPLAATAAQSRELVAAAAAQGVVLMVGHVFLFNGGILKLKTLIDDNVLGRVHYASAVRTNLGPIRDDVNAAYDLASHDVSIFNFLFEHAPLTVSACGKACLKPHIEDIVFATLTYPNGVVVGLEATWLNPKKVRQITIVGDAKMVTWDDLSAGPVSIYDKGITTEPFYDSFGEFHLLAREGDVTIPKVRLEEPMGRQARFFLEAIRSGSAGICSGERGAEVVETLEAINASMRRGGIPVTVGTS